MDAIAGFLSENGVIVLFIILAAVGLLWLLSRFFKLTLVIAIVVLVFLAAQHFMPSGGLKTQFKGVIDSVTTKTGEVVDSAKGFFTDQKGKMQKHMNEALENGEKKDAATGSKKK
jgi:cell shape-determining protein MreC